jgi:hypothetical protein
MPPTANPSRRKISISGSQVIGNQEKICQNLGGILKNKSPEDCEELKKTILKCHRVSQKVKDRLQNITLLQLLEEYQTHANGKALSDSTKHALNFILSRIRDMGRTNQSIKDIANIISNIV